MSPEDFLKNVSSSTKTEPPMEIVEKKLADDLKAAKSDIKSVESIDKNIDHIYSTLNTMSTFDLISKINMVSSINFVNKNIYHPIFTTFRSFKTNILKKVKSAKDKSVDTIITTKDNIQLYFKRQQFVNRLYDSISTSVKNVGSYLGNTFINGVTTAYVAISNVISTVGKFFINLASSGWSKIDKFLSSIGGRLWGAIKSVVSVITKPIAWMYKIGKKALEFIWSGISTIFSFGYAVLSTVVGKVIEYAGKGVNFFFKWWFKLFLNTLFNPVTLIVAIPLFIGVSSFIFAGLSLVFAAGAPILQALFGKSFDIIKTVGNFIWKSIETFFNWIDTSLSKFDTYNEVKAFTKSLFNGIINWFGGNEYFQKAIKWVRSKYDWVRDKSAPIINYIKDGIVKVKDFIGDDKSVIEKFVVFLKSIKESYFGFASGGIGLAIEFIERWYGASMGLTKDMGREIQTQSKLLATDILAQRISVLESQGKSRDEIEKELNTIAIPLLSETSISEDFSDEQVSKIVESAFSKSLDVSRGINNFMSPGELSRRINNTLDLKRLRDQIRSGTMSGDDRSEINVLAKQSLEKSKSYNDSVKTKENTKILTLDSNTKLLNDIKALDHMRSRVRSVQTIGEFNAQVNEYGAIKRSLMTARNFFVPVTNTFVPYFEFKTESVADNMDTSSFTGNVPAFTGGGYKTTQADNVKSEAKSIIGLPSTETQKKFYESVVIDTDEILRSPGVKDISKYLKKWKQWSIEWKDPSIYTWAEQSFNVAQLSVAKRLNLPGYKDGGIIEKTNILKLDINGKEFIKEKLKSVIGMVPQNTTKKDNKTNITIIEDNHINIESYEMYTMTQLSKGILGAH